MSVTVTREFTVRARQRDWITDLGAAVAALVVLFAFHTVGGFSGLTDGGGDNDRLMRLVEVRDLIAGQGWFDLHQYRMGLEGGFVMHWSRIVDAPIAGIILAGAFLTGDMATAERIALVLWPLLLFGIAVFLIIRAAGEFGGTKARLSALVVGAITLYAGPGLFEPGSLDHHNLQLVLTLTVIVCLLASSDNRVAAYGAGASAALMLAIGMETMPHVAVGGVCVAGMFLVYGAPERLRAVRFGLAFGTTALINFVLTVPRETWFAPQCDAFSIAQFALAAVAGFGLALVAGIPLTNGNAVRRAFGLGGLAAAVVLLIGIAFPQCVGDPYAALDPRLHELWLDSVSEAQSVRSILLHDPVSFASYYIVPLVALAVLAFQAWRHRFERRHAIVAAFLVGAFLVSFWQVRGSMFSVPIAVIPLSAWIGERRALVEAAPSSKNLLAMILAWLLSLNLVWLAAASVTEKLIDRESSAAKDGADARECYEAVDYDRLAALPRDTVLAVSNLGASILRYTPHRALAGSYHRNVEGNLATLDIFLGNSEAAQRAVRRLGIGLVAHCPDNAEIDLLAKQAPDSLIAELSRDHIPDWLEVVPGSENAALRLYRVRHQ